MEIKRCYDTIIGASVGENQLVQSGDTSVTVPNGHKYYSKINGTETLGASTGTAIAINDSAKDMVTDLTQKLGLAIADYVYGLGTSSGIAKLREWGFLRGYQAYNSGSLESVEVTGKVVRGFNQWDEEWESGQYNLSTGTKASRDDAIRCKNPIPVKPNTSYYFGCTSHTSTGDGVWLWYTQDGTLINYVTNKLNREQTSPSNAYFMTFYVAPETTYNHDICINLSSDRNGEYEPYTEQTYDYGDDTLNGIFKLDANNNLYADGDRKESDGTITRKYKKIIVNAFTGAWGATNNGYSVYLSLNDWKNSRVYANAISDKFVFSPNTYSTMPVMTFVGGSGASGTVSFILPSTVTTLAEANDWARQNPFTIVYELATPTTEQSTPFPSPQVCYPDGTEEYVTSNGVPVGHETRYEL